MEATGSYLLMLQKYIKAKDSEIKDYTLCLGNISNDFTINNMRKTRLEIHRHLMKKKTYIKCLR